MQSNWWRYQQHVEQSLLDSVARAAPPAGWAMRTEAIARCDARTRLNNVSCPTWHILLELDSNNDEKQNESSEFGETVGK